MLQNYQNCVTDSSANGKNNILICMAIVVISILGTVGSFLDKNFILNTKKYSCDVEEDEPMSDNFPSSLYFLMTEYFFISIWYLWNKEFKDFVYRKVSAKFCCFVGPPKIVTSMAHQFRQPKNRVHPISSTFNISEENQYPSKPPLTKQIKNKNIVFVQEAKQI